MDFLLFSFCSVIVRDKLIASLTGQQMSAAQVVRHQPSL